MEGEGEFEGHTWNRGGSLRKRLEDGDRQNKELAVFRGVSAVWLGLEELEERVMGGPCQEAFSHTGRMGKNGS